MSEGFLILGQPQPFGSLAIRKGLSLGIFYPWEKTALWEVVPHGKTVSGDILSVGEDCPLGSSPTGEDYL